MPFTPFHMGPGLLVKALLQSSFSLMIFGWAQILMDLQPLFVLLTGKGHLHGFSHTYLGASLIAFVAGISGKYLLDFFLKYRENLLPSLQKRFGNLSPKIAWPVALASSFLGTFSHIFLDSLMHGDLQPFYPFSIDHPFLLAISIKALHQFCIYSGLLGGVLYFLIRFFKIKKQV